jgi:acyl carrier protein
VSRAEAATASRAEIVEALSRKVAELSEGRLAFEDVDATASVLDHGYIDSLSAVRLLGFIEERYGVDVPERELVGRAHSLAGLAEYIERARA